MTVSPAEYVTAIQPVPVTGSILNAAFVDDVPGGHWELGFDYEPVACGDVRPIADICAPGEKEVDTIPGVLDGDVFGLYLLQSCKSVGGRWSNANAKVEQGFLRGEAAGVERAIEVFINNGSLSGLPIDDWTPTEGTAVPLADGLAVLEEVVARNGGGIVHMPRRLASMLGTRLELTTGGQLRTRLGTPVAAGGGYRGDIDVGSVDAADGTRWMYGTGPMLLRRGAVVTTGPTVDSGTNEVAALTERVYGVVAECFVAAVLVESTAGGA